MEVREAIAQSYLARGLTSAAIDRLVGLASTEHYASGAFIINEEEESRDLMILVSGRAGIQKAGQEQLGTIRPGMPFGEVAFIDGKARSSSVVAETDCEVVRLNGERLEAALREEPEMAMTALYNLARVLCDRLRRANQEIAALQLSDD